MRRNGYSTGASTFVAGAWSSAGMRPVALGGRITVEAWQQGLLFRDGVLVERMDPGSRRVWSRRSRLGLVDLRPWMLTVPTQEVPTADGVTVKVTVAGQARVTDAGAFVMANQDPQGVLYLAVQVALRELTGRTSLESLTNARHDLGTELHAAVRGIDEIGVVLDRLELKDVVLPADLKRAQAQVLLAKAEGQAAIERARGETAALRSLANAARLTAANPALFQLRLLQQLAATSGHTVVIGSPTGALGPLGADPANGAPEAGSAGS